ncbi:SLC13 family permease [Gilvimarinus sp. F26214L]|uniref:SLC13 family permease n=1 Tax=Gilvimarinus sp. DZF01 TaxID=3461371 RepID=UPI004045B6CE
MPAETLPLNHTLHQFAALAKHHALWWAPTLALVLGVTMANYGWSREACFAGGIAFLTAAWWIFEPIPLAATSLIPLGAFPMLGVLSGQQVASAYGNPLILLFVGGSLLSKALEKTNTHQQLALGTVRLIGGVSSRRLVIGFMLASALLSMWISNTATALMLLPIVLAVLEKAEDRRLGIPLLLGVAYGASIGGMATHIGSPPNLVFMSAYQQYTGEALTLLDWMGWGLPAVVLMIPLAALWLTRNLDSGGGVNIPDPGAWTTSQKRVLVVFGLTALAWITRGNPFGGWQSWLGLEKANDASVAFIAVVALFLIPAGGNEHKNEKLLDWEHAVRIPWGIFILFAGGLAIAEAFTTTGISDALGQALGGLSSLPPIVLILVVCLTVTFLTEVTSNTATSTMLMPVLAAAATGAGMDPKLLMVPAALSASCAFMLPVATPPNVIVFSANRLTVREMAREGLVLNLLGAIVITTVVYFVAG